MHKIRKGISVNYLDCKGLYLKAFWDYFKKVPVLSKFLKVPNSYIVVRGT